MKFHKDMLLLYGVTDQAFTGEKTLTEQIEEALSAGVTLLQLREMCMDKRVFLEEALLVRELTKHYGIPLIINDDVELAAQVGAAGVHVGKDDPAFAIARACLGKNALIGVSCYDRLDLALEAAQAGADYVAFGALFPSPTKPTEIRAPIALLRKARAALHIPIVAIGGITPDNAPLLLDVGADALAVVSGVFGQPDIQAAARRYANLFA